MRARLPSGEQGDDNRDIGCDEGAICGVHVFKGEWDEEGVCVYQAFGEAIADWAVEHQTLGHLQRM